MANDLSLQHVVGELHGDVLVATITAKQIRDTTLAYALRDEMISLVDRTQAKHVVFDVRNVTFIGSVGFLAFMGIRRHLAGGRVILCNLPENIRQMFVVCRLIATGPATTAPFEDAPTLDDALAQFA